MSPLLDRKEEKENLYVTIMEPDEPWTFGKNRRPVWDFGTSYLVDHPSADEPNILDSPLPHCQMKFQRGALREWGQKKMIEGVGKAAHFPVFE